MLTVLIDGFQHQQHRSKLKDGGADEGGPAPAYVDFAGEFGGGRGEGEPDEEGVDDPDDGAWGGG